MTTVVIPVMNCLDYTRMCIATIRSHHPLHLLILDNGSTDGTQEYFLAGEGRKENIRYVSWAENRGVSHAWNFGIRDALDRGSSHCLVLNNDILLDAAFVDRMADFLRDNPRYLLASGTPCDREDLDRQNRADHIDTRQLNFCAFMVVPEFVKRAGWFDESFFPGYFNDNDMAYRMRLANVSGCSLGSCAYFHFTSKTMAMNPKAKQALAGGIEESRAYYVAKWGGLPEKEAFQVMFNAGKMNASMVSRLVSFRTLRKAVRNPVRAVAFLGGVLRQFFKSRT